MIAHGLPIYVALEPVDMRLGSERPLDNTRSERALRKIVVGRKAWMFYGSDTHAEAAAAIFSIIASCRLHRLDPFAYLDELLRVLPYWPRERYLELSPKQWSATRARLRPEELAAPLLGIRSASGPAQRRPYRVRGEVAPP